MENYIKNIIPRLKQYGKKLNKIESFVDKTWMLYDIDNGVQTFRFQRNGKLFITVSDGKTEEYKWEHLPPDSLYIKKEASSGIMYRQAFFLEDLLIMQVEAVGVEPVLFYNEARVPNGDLLNYIKTLSKNKWNIFPIGNGNHYYSNRYGTELNIGSTVFDSDLNELKTENLTFENVEISIKDSIVEKLAVKNTLETDEGYLYTITSNHLDGPVINDEIRYVYNNELVKTGTYKIKKHPKILKIKIKNGQIVDVNRVGEFTTEDIISCLGFIVIVFVVIMLLLFLINPSLKPTEVNSSNIITQENIDVEKVRLDKSINLDTAATLMINTSGAVDTNYHKNLESNFLLFNMTESSIDDMDIKIYLEKILFKLHYVSVNYPNEINAYLQAAKDINRKPIYINNLQKFITFDSFVDDYDLSTRVSNIVSVDFISGSYFVTLDFYHV